MNASLSFFAFLTINLLQFYDAFIIPDEVPSLLSVIYSNIPVVKKGTDSRLGWGFRLGDRADFQVLVELGPQMYTQPLANQPDKTVSSKRQSLNTLSDVLYAQRQQDKRKHQDTISNTDGGKWIDNWSKAMKKPKPKPGLAIGEIDAKSVIPEDETGATSKE